jgi:glycosyltransferase involved in cell wall biosynthesis
MRLYVVSPFPPEYTGVGQYGWTIVNGLAATGRFSEITVLAPKIARPNGQHSEAAGVGRKSPIRVRRVWALDDPLAAGRLARNIAHGRPDAVWFNLGLTVFGDSRPVNFLGLMAPLLVRHTSARLVVTLHQLLEATPPSAIGAKNGRITSLGARTATRMLLTADAVCVTLRRYRDLLENQYGARNVAHIPLGASNGVEYLPRPAGAPPEDILFFGSAAPYKGLPVLLEAYRRLKLKRPQATLTIAGADHPRFPGYTSGMRSEVEAQRAGSSGIRWLGPVPEERLRDVFARARVVAMPYLASTGGSSVVHRAAGYGRPIVASDLPDLRAAMHEEGLRLEMVAPGDGAALASALEAMLADTRCQDAQARHNLAVMSKMTLAHTSASYLKLLKPATT